MVHPSVRKHREWVGRYPEAVRRMRQAMRDGHVAFEQEHKRHFDAAQRGDDWEAFLREEARLRMN